MLAAAAAWVVLRVLQAGLPWPAAAPEPDVAVDRRRGSPRHLGRTARLSRSRTAVAPRVLGPAARRNGRPGADPAEIAAAVDLLGVAVSAGHSLFGAIAVVGHSGSGNVAAAFAEVDRRVRDGGSLRAELSVLVDLLGEPARPLAATLAASLSSGSPLTSQLQRLADAERARERRRRQEWVRRLPVLLLAPLVGLILPAFVLLAVVPVALTSIRPLTTPAVPAAPAGDVQIGSLEVPTSTEPKRAPDEPDP